MKTIRVTYSSKNTSFDKRIKASIEKKKLINKYIREAKDLKELNDSGIKFKQPV